MGFFDFFKTETSPTIRKGAKYVFVSHEGPIPWRVLDVSGSKALLVTEKVIDAVVYNSFNTDTTWAKCSLRRYLNEVFLQIAFNDAERSSILKTTISTPNNPMYYTRGGEDTLDSVFCLSIEEVEKYLPTQSNRISEPTPFAESKGAIDIGAAVRASILKAQRPWENKPLKEYMVKPSTTGSVWLLRSPGYKENYVAHVGTSGEVNYEGWEVTNLDCRIRPALYLKLQ